MKGGSLFPGKGMGFIHPHHNPLQQEERAAFTLTSILSPQGRGRLRKMFSLGEEDQGKGFS
jgi:hypothetical protein